MTLTLYGSPPAWQLVSISPFCTKLELYLRIVGAAYQRKAFDPFKAPKGMMPFIDDGSGVIGDSQLIIERFESQSAAPLDASLTDAQRAQGHALRRMLDEGAYFAGLYSRWVDDDGWRVFSPVFGKVLPGPARFALPLIRKRSRTRITQQGTGRHTKAEIYALANADFDAVAVTLADKPFLFGDAPTTYDCSAFAFVDAVLGFPVDNALRRHVASKPNLVAYRDRIRARWFGDLSR